MKCLKVALLALSLLFTAATMNVRAEEGRHMISAGWLHIDNHPDSDPLTTTSVRSGASRTDSGTQFTVDDLDTAVITYSYSFTANLSGLVLGGIPPKIKLKGSGTSAIVGDLDQYDTLATAKQMTPTLMGQYTFGEENQTVRPFVGLGAAYTHLSDVKLDSAVEQAFINAVKAQTLGAAQEVDVRVKTENMWSPVAALGVQARFAPGWYAIGTISYLPLETTTTVTTSVTKSASPALLKTGDFSHSKTTISVDPTVYYLGIGYRF